MSHSMGVSRTFPRAFFAGIILVLIGLPGLASAQSSSSNGDGHHDWTGSDSVTRSPDQSWKTNVFTGFEFQGETDLDAGGDFEYWMISGGVSSARMLGDDVKVALKADYRAIGYDFSGIGGGVDPWETVSVLRLNPLFTYLLNDRWSVMGGPILEFTGEEKADFGDSLRGGGLVGFGYKREGYFIAFGVIAMTEIEKDNRILPFVLVNWNITDGLMFGVKADTSRGGELRLDYAITKKFKMGAGIGVRRELFRLNDDGPAATGRRDGVGEETATVAKITAIYQINKVVTVEGYGGVTLDGEFRLETKTGNKIATSDYDDSGFGGVNFRFNF
jgi:hypothetical protein